MFLVHFIFFFFSTAAAYSIHYYAPTGHAGVVGDEIEFSRSPSAVQVADIYARLGGHAPILKEDVVSLPTVDIFHNSKTRPVLLNVVGEVIPGDLTPIVRAQRGPSVNKVSDVLAANGIDVEIKEMINVNEGDISVFLSQQERPVVVVFSDISASPVTRRLQSDLNGTTPLTEYEISSYQIFYWVEFAVILLLLSGVFAIVGMDIVPDSLLFAKFQSSRTNKID